MGEAPDELGAPPAPSSHVDDKNGDVDEIRDDIEHTRAELSVTIDSIQERLAPQALVEQAKEAALGAGTDLVEGTKTAIVGAAQAKADEYYGKAERMVTELGDTARGTSGGMLETIKANPVPTALAAASIGWLLTHRRKAQPRTESHPYTGWTDADYPRGHDAHRDSGMGHQIDRAQDKAGDLMDSARGSMGQVADTASDTMDRAGRLATSAGSTAMDTGTDVWDVVRRNPVPAAMAGVGIAWLWLNRDEPRIRPVDTMSSTMEPVGDLASRARGQVGDVADRTMGQMSDAAERARGQIADLSDTAQDRAYQARGQLGRMLEEAPLAVGAAAVAIGAAIGLAIPTTTRERELMGDARESFMDRTQQLAQQAQDRLMQAAERVQDTAKDELQHAQSDITNDASRMAS